MRKEKIRNKNRKLRDKRRIMVEKAYLIRLERFYKKAQKDIENY